MTSDETKPLTRHHLESMVLKGLAEHAGKDFVFLHQGIEELDFDSLDWEEATLCIEDNIGEELDGLQWGDYIGTPSFYLVVHVVDVIQKELERQGLDIE